MKKEIAFGFAMACTAAGFAGVVADSVAFEQDATTRMVKITYRLDAPAIVTLGLELDGTAVGDQALSSAVGDVYKYVDKVGKDCTIWWQPSRVLEPCTAANAKAIVRTWATDNPPLYMVFDLDVVHSVRFYESKEGLPGGVSDGRYKTTRLVMRRISAADVQWRMGSPWDNSVWYWRQSPDGENAHLVTMARDYYIGVYEFTQYQYARLKDGQNPTGEAAQGTLTYQNLRGSGDDYDWPNKGHAVADGSVMGMLRARTGQQFDLPTEAQWEYACRAGNKAPYYTGSVSDDKELDKIAWFYTNAKESIKAVGQKIPNAWGLYDMLGNAAELCLDWSGDYVNNNSTFDGEPAGPTTGSNRVIRGGYSGQGSDCITTSYRNRITPTTSHAVYGFRVACPAVYVPPAAD